MNPAVSQSRAIAPVAFEDGLGERLYAVGAANEPLEVLKISSELSWVGTFEEALREQTARLAEFRHEAFGRVRAIERLDSRSSTIVVISDHVRGVRLSEVLAGAKKRSITLEFAAAGWLIRQLVSATAALHDSGPGVFHGAIAAERLVLTRDGRLVLVEYVLGPALEEMRFSWERYWRELAIALPRPIGLPHFDQTADVTQVAAVSLALLLGRPLAVDEYPHRIADVLESATAQRADGADALPAALRTWLRRALHIEPRAAFASAVDAQTELDRALDLDDATGRAALKSFLARYATALVLERQAAQTKVEPVAPALAAVPVAAAEPVPEPVTAAPVVEPTPPPAVATPFVPVVPEPAFVPVAVHAREPAPPPAPVADPPVVTSPSLTSVPLARFEAPAPVAPFSATPSRAVPGTVMDDDTAAADAADEEAESEAGTVGTVTPFPTPASFVPPAPPSLGVRSVTPFGSRAAAAELRVPEPEPIETPVYTPLYTPPPQPEPAPVLSNGFETGRLQAETMSDDEDDAPHVPAVAAAARNARPVWTSPWAIAGVVILIAVTTGVTMMGRRGPTVAPPVSSTGTLEIGTNPDGVPVIIDGTERGMTPLTVTLSAGAHVVELVNGAERRKVPVAMKAGAHVAHFIELPKVAAGVGDLQVRTDPSKATVRVDGKVYGRTPVTVKGLTAGLHKVVLENESGTFSDDVLIEPGATASLVVPMTTRPQGGTTSGWIAITAPADLQVFEEGRLVGSSRTDRIMVAVGRHNLELVNEALGYRSIRTVDVSPGLVAVVRPDWPKGSMAVNALPWAEVSIDGERVGETPIGSVSVPIGTHEIVFRHPDLGERRTTATVTTGASTRVSMDMRAK